VAENYYSQLTGAAAKKLNTSMSITKKQQSCANSESRISFDSSFKNQQMDSFLRMASMYKTGQESIADPPFPHQTGTDPFPKYSLAPSPRTPFSFSAFGLEYRLFGFQDCTSKTNFWLSHCSCSAACFGVPDETDFVPRLYRARLREISCVRLVQGDVTNWNGMFGKLKVWSH